MKVYNLSKWRKQRAMLLQHCRGHKAKSSRGEYKYIAPFIVRDATHSECGNISEKMKGIIEAEVSLIYTGTSTKPDITKELYKDDDKMLLDYSSLEVERLIGKDNSRNNIISVPGCCLCQWQLLHGELIVYSRSMDIRAAGLSDCLVAREIARRLGAKRWTIISIHPHIYTDATKVARKAK